MPGKLGAKYRKKLKRLDLQRDYQLALLSGHGKVAIDLGANVGEFSAQMAPIFRKVYAFEPDPWTVERLRTRLEDFESVEIVQAAASTENGQMSIYRAPDFFDDPAKKSLSSTLVQSKLNVAEAATETVQALDFVQFLRELDEDVHLLKIDIEGAEVALLEKLLDDPVLDRVSYVFVETHETRVPDLAARTEALRQRVDKHSGPTSINLEWT